MINRSRDWLARHSHYTVSVLRDRQATRPTPLAVHSRPGQGRQALEPAAGPTSAAVVKTWGNAEGTTIVMVTHSEHDARYAHRILRLLDGEVVLENIKEQFSGV